MAEIKLTNLRALEPNWDSYGAPAPDLRAIEVAEMILNTPAEVVPTHEGGLQIEWHLGTHTVELEIRADGSQVLGVT
jgi:hypothetical protein